MSSLISVDEEERVTRVNEGSAIRAVRDAGVLAVFGNQKTVKITWTPYAWQPLRTLVAWETRSAFLTCREKPINNTIVTYVTTVP